MRQVPFYLIIGNGRVARHFSYYFSLLNVPVKTWCRQDPIENLQEVLNSATHILLLINDRAIDNFIDQHLSETSAIKIHFSGSLVSEKAYGVHPLMSFGQDLYELKRYQEIPFVVDHDAPDFSLLLPGLSNFHARLDKSQKAKYHALCVLSSNFNCLLWQKLMHSLEQEFNLPREFAKPLLNQCTTNLLLDSERALTGPLARNDLETIAANLAALENDPFQNVYKSFVSAYQKMKGSY